MSAIKKIIVPLDSSGYCEAAIQKACEVARVHQAAVTGLTVLDMPGITAHIPPGDIYLPIAIDETVRRFIESAEQQIAEARQKFVAACDAAGVAHLDTSSEGVPCSQILDAAKLHDLMVVGQRTFFDFATAGGGHSLAGLLNRTVTPILAIPKGSGDRKMKRALVAYDGSMNAARTLREFAAFVLPFGCDITVLTAAIDQDSARWILEDAASYLRAHGLGKVELVHRPEKSISDDIIGQYDIVAAGIHSKRFLIERSVGGFTRKLIERDDTLLFLSH